METQKALREFFEEQLENNISPFFLYKDIQLLKQDKFREFADEQLKKANKIFLSVAAGILYCVVYGTISLIRYGQDSNWMDISFGVICWVAVIGATLKAAKEYYTIRSSMELFLKLIDEEGEVVPQKKTAIA